MIETEFFNIVTLLPKDAKSLSEMILSNFDRLQLYFPVTISKNKTLNDTRIYIAKKQQENLERSGFTLGIKDKETAKIAGLIIIKKINWETKQGEFAYCISSEYEGKGWITKAVKAMTAYGFDVLGFKKFQIIAHKTNVGSCKVAEKCGFQWKQTLLKEFTPTNETPLDMELYELEYEG